MSMTTKIKRNLYLKKKKENCISTNYSEEIIDKNRDKSKCQTSNRKGETDKDRVGKYRKLTHEKDHIQKNSNIEICLND